MTEEKTLYALHAALLDELRTVNASGRTIRNSEAYAGAFLRWLDAEHGVRTPDALRRKHVEAWQKHQRGRRTTRGLPLKISTINTYNDSVRTFLRYLVRHGYIQKGLPETLAYVKAPKLLPSSVLTHVQVRKLLSRIDTGTPAGQRDRTMLEILYSTGIRVAELLGLNTEQVDIANATLLVRGKGRKERMVPVGRTAVRFLESYIVAVRPFLVRQRACNPRGSVVPPEDEQALFLTSRGTRVSYPRFLEYVHAYAKAAGIDGNVTPHTFRRSCTTELLRGGANMYHVKDLLGHESLETLTHYARLTITDLKKTHAKCHPREKDERR